MAKNPSYRDNFLRIRNSELKPSYVLSGEEDFLRETAVKMIIEKANTKDEDEVTVTKVYGEELEAEELSVDLLSYSLFSDWKFVIIKDAGKMKYSCWKVVDTYIKEPLDKTVLILEDEKIKKREKKTDESDNSDKSTGTLKSFIMKNSLCLDFPLLYDNQILDWMVRYTSKISLQVGPEALRILVDANENNLRIYVNEFEKLLLNFPDGKLINESDMLDFIQVNRGFKIFEFLDSICEAKGSCAIAQLQQIILQNENAPYVLVMITRQLTNLLKIRIYLDKGIHGSNISKVSGINHYVVRKSLPQAEKISVDELRDLLEATLEADKGLKTGYQTDKIILTILIQKFISVFSRNAA